MKILGERIVQLVKLDERGVKLMKIGKLVRCKDCKHRPDEFGHNHPLFYRDVNRKRIWMICPFGDRGITDDFFCAYGERKDEP